MAERKEYDLFVNLLSNLQASFDNLITSGLSIDNTSLLDRSVYENNDEIRLAFTDNNGEFDKAKFDAFYNDTKVYYNYLSQTDYHEAIKRLASFHRSNMYAEPEKRRTGPDFFETKVANPYKLTESIISPGLYGERLKSVDEIMLSNHVLLNPTSAGENLENAQWGDTPDNNFIGYADDVLVQAQYDTDGTHKDLITGEIVSHKAGELKTDENGDFYYELLDGRSVYNRRVLNKLNVLTKEDSWLNKLDFFDSDDLNLKNPIGSVMRNVALVGSMFIPYVGPWIAGISIATLLAGLFGTLGKMATMDSNNSFFSYLEGWSKSVNRLNQSTEYAQNHPWCLENMLNLAGDVFGQLKEQRFIFEKVPSLFKGASLINKLNEDARKLEYVNKHKKLLQTKLGELEKGGASRSRLALFELAMNANATAAAQAEMDSFIKGYNKLGEIISRGYMTAITVGDTYGEAKNAGASDIDATWLTLGYAFAEYQLLKTGFGRWNLPETRLDQYRNEAIAKALFTAKKSTENIVSSATRDAKRSYALKLFNAGKKAFNEVWTANKANGLKTVAATLTSAAAEGVEEVSEELLADFSKSCYNTIKWLQGNDIRINAFGYNFQTNEWHPTEIRDRYLLSLIGGAIGGGLTNAVTNYKMIDSYNNMNTKQAVELLVYMTRNGEIDLFLKDINKIELDDPNLSTNFEWINEQPVFDPGTKENNRDLAFKQVIHLQVKILQDVLNASGAKSDNEFLSDLTLNDLRYAALLDSTTAGAYILEYNDLLSEIAQATNDLKALTAGEYDTNNNGIVEDKEKQEKKQENKQENKVTQKAISEKLKLIKEKQQLLDDLVSGKRTLEFAATALWELNAFLSGVYNKQTLPLFAELKFGKKVNELTPEEIKQAKEEYNRWKPSMAREDLHRMAMSFLEFTKLFSSVVKEDELTYLNNSETTRKIMRSVDALNRLFLLKSSEKVVSSMLEMYELPPLPERGSNLPILMSNLSGNIASDLISILGTDELKRQITDIDKRRLEAIRALPKNSTEEQRAAVHHPFNKELTELVYRVIKDNIEYYTLEIINSGFATKEVKNLLSQLILEIQTRLLPEEIAKRNEEIEDEINANVDPLTGDFPESYIEPINEWQELNVNLTQAIRDIEALPETPLESNLNKFAITIGRDPLIISLLIDKLNAAFNETKDNLSNFTVDELGLELDNAILTMHMYASTIKAARTDNLNFDNLAGFNSTLNEIASRTGEDLQLAEIDKDVADMFMEDLNTNLNKLLLLKRLYFLNRGLKLSKLSRVSTKKDILMYKRMKYIVQVLDKIEGIDEESVKLFQSIMQTLSLHEELANSGLLNVSNEEEFLKENLAIENAIFDFFNTNKFLLEDSSKLALLLSPENLDLYGEANEILNEDTQSIDDNSFIWWLASRASLRLEDFYHQYGEIIDLNAEKPLAPIATQELAIYNNYASIINGGIFNTFYEAIRKAIKNDWKSEAETDRAKVKQKRESILKRLNKSIKYADDKYLDYVFNLISAPRYSNIVFTEGIAGSGKSSAVFKLTAELLKKFHPDLLKNVIIAHGANKDSANGLKENIGIDLALTFGRDELMKYISTEWKEYAKNSKNEYIVPNSDYYISNEHEIRSKLDINKSLTDVPNVIFIDEISNFTGYDLDLIDKFARFYGITVLVAGDLDQSGIIGTHNIEQGPFKGESWKINLDRTNFIRSPKLGVSMRTDNVFKTGNLIKAQLYIHDSKGTLDLDYTETEEGLFGDKVITYNTSSLDTQVDKNYKLLEIFTWVDKMSATLKEVDGKKPKIGYIYNNKNSKLFEELSKRPDVELYYGTSAQGLEGLYFIIDLDYTSDYNTYLKDLYTGISRALQGSLIIVPKVSDDNKFPKIEDHLKQEIPVKEPLGKESIRRFASKRKTIISKISTNGKALKYIPRPKIDDTFKPALLPSQLPQGTKQAELDAALKQAMEAEKQSILLLIGQAKTEAEINQIISNSKYAQLSTDPDIIAAKTLKIEAINNEVRLKQALIQQLLVAINSANTLELLDAIINSISPEIVSEIQSAYDSLKSKIKQNIQRQELDFINQLIIDLSNARTITDLDSIMLNAQSVYPNIINDPIVDEVYNRTKNIIKLEEEIEAGFLLPIPSVDALEEDISLPDASPDIMNPSEYESAIIHDSESENIPENTASDEKLDEPIHIDMLFHTFNSFETGVLEDEDGNVVLIGDPIIRRRIDSVNGLIKIDELLGFKPRKLKEYVEILGDLRSIIFNTESKSDIDRKIKDYFGFDDIYTTFAFKGSMRKGSNFKTDVDGYSLSKPNPIEKTSLELTLFNGSNDTDSKKILDKSLVLIIGTKANKNLLELPLLSFSSPFTILLTKDKNKKFIFSEVYKTFDTLAKGQNSNWKQDLDNNRNPNLDLFSIANGIIAAHANNKKYSELIELFRLFVVTSNFIRYIKNDLWTPVRNLHLNGAYVTTEKGYYQLSDGLRFNDEINTPDLWINVADFAGVTNFGNKVNPYHNPQSTVTLIFVCTDNEIGGVKLPINQGHPFVLVCYDKDIQGEENIIEQYIELVRNPELPKKVIRLYVRCPDATVGEYCDLIHEFIHNPDPSNPKYISIGYFSTYFKLLKGLIQDPNNPECLKIINLINRKLGKVAPLLLDLLNNIPLNASVKELNRILNETRDWTKEGGIGKGPEKITYLLRTCLDKLGYIKDFESGEYSRDDVAITMMEEAAKNLGINLYHHYPIPRNDHNRNKYFILPDPNKTYSIHGKPCLIHGKVDSYNFTGRMGWFIHDLVRTFNLPKDVDPNSKPEIVNNYWRLYDNVTYYHGDSNWLNKSNEQETKLNNIITLVKTKTGIDLDSSIFTNKPLNQAINDIANLINSTLGNNLAFVINGELRITEPKLQGSNKIIYYNGLSISDISLLINTSGLITLEISIDGKRYTAELDYLKGKIELYEQNEEDSITYNQIISSITPEIITDYINEGRVLFAGMFQKDEDGEVPDEDLAFLFESDSYETFMLRLQELEYLPPIDDSGNISWRLDMFEIFANAKTDLQKKILHDLTEIEKYKKKESEQCPTPINTILF